MALMFAIWRPQPNWMPPKPKLIFQICQNDSRGLNTDFAALLTVVDTRELLESSLMLRRKLALDQTPLPVTPGTSGNVHPRAAIEADDVLHRNQNVGRH